MSSPCAQCRQPLSELELSLKCANPRCTSLCHPSCASGPLLLNDGGRVPRWRCSECQLVSPVQESGYESVYGRPRSGDTLKRIKDDWGKNRTIDALHLRDRDRGHFDRDSSYRASTGAILGRNSRPTDLKFALPVRPKSVILTPTPTEDDAEPVKVTMEPKKEPVAPKSTTHHHPNNPVPVRLVTPDEKYDETVKSFYKWLEEHECASKDKGGNRGGLVKDKIAQFGSKLEDHLASRNTDKGHDIGRAKVQHPVPKSGTKWGSGSQNTWPKQQTVKQSVNIPNEVKSNDPMEGKYYSGKLIEAEKNSELYGGLNQLPKPVQLPNRSNVAEANMKSQHSDYGVVYANQDISGRGREKSPVAGTQREVPNQTLFGGSINRPGQLNMPKNDAIHAKSGYSQGQSFSKQQDGNFAAVYANQSALTNTSVSHEKQPVGGIPREGAIHKPIGGSVTINYPVQSNTIKQMPTHPNQSTNPNLKKQDGDYGVLYAKPQKLDANPRSQEKSGIGGIEKSEAGGNVDGLNKGRSIDDGRIYHNATPVLQRGTQVTEVSSLKPVFGKPKSSLSRKVEVSDDEFSQEEDDFPPPPPCLETDLDRLEPDVEVKSVESAGGSTEKAMVDRKSFNDPTVAEISDAGDDRRSLSVGQEIHEDARIVQHASLPARGTFTLSIVKTNNENQDSLSLPSGKKHSTDRASSPVMARVCLAENCGRDLLREGSSIKCANLACTAACHPGCAERGCEVNGWIIRRWMCFKCRENERLTNEQGLLCQKLRSSGRKHSCCTDCLPSLNHSEELNTMTLHSLNETSNPAYSWRQEIFNNLDLEGKEFFRCNASCIYYCRVITRCSSYDLVTYRCKDHECTSCIPHGTSSFSMDQYDNANVQGIKLLKVTKRSSASLDDLLVNDCAGKSSNDTSKDISIINKLMQTLKSSVRCSSASTGSSIWYVDINKEAGNTQSRPMKWQLGSGSGSVENTQCTLSNPEHTPPKSWNDNREEHFAATIESNFHETGEKVCSMQDDMQDTFPNLYNNDYAVDNVGKRDLKYHEEGFQSLLERMIPNPCGKEVCGNSHITHHNASSLMSHYCKSYEGSQSSIKTPNKSDATDDIAAQNTSFNTYSEETCPNSQNDSLGEENAFSKSYEEVFETLLEANEPVQSYFKATATARITKCTSILPEANLQNVALTINRTAKAYCEFDEDFQLSSVPDEQISSNSCGAEANANFTLSYHMDTSSHIRDVIVAVDAREKYSYTYEDVFETSLEAGETVPRCCHASENEYFTHRISTYGLSGTHPEKNELDDAERKYSEFQKEFLESLEMKKPVLRPGSPVPSKVKPKPDDYENVVTRRASGVYTALVARVSDEIRFCAPLKENCQRL